MDNTPEAENLDEDLSLDQRPLVNNHSSSDTAEDTQNEVPQRLPQPHLETCSPLRLHLPAGAVKSRCTVSIQVGTSSLPDFYRLAMQWQISAFFYN